MNIQTIARTLGGDVAGRNRVLCAGPGHSRRDRSLSVTFDHDDFTVHSFANDDWRACRDHVAALLGLPGFDGRRWEVRVAPRPAPIEDDRDGINAALDIWRRTGEAAGTVVEHYLRERGLAGFGRNPISDLRFHGSLKFEGVPCFGMVALMRDIVTNRPCGVHRTFLDARGRKLGRKMLGRAKGACVKLCGDDEVTSGLGIAEGIETALSVIDEGWKPVWACLSAGTMAAFPVLAGVDCVTVFADNDESGTGERAAQECCTRWLAADREAVAITPDFVGDWNDTCGVAA